MYSNLDLRAYNWFCCFYIFVLMGICNYITTILGIVILRATVIHIVTRLFLWLKDVVMLIVPNWIIQYFASIKIVVTFILCLLYWFIGNQPLSQDINVTFLIAQLSVYRRPVFSVKAPPGRVRQCSLYVLCLRHTGLCFTVSYTQPVGGSGGRPNSWITKIVQVCDLCFGHSCHLFLSGNLPKKSNLEATWLSLKIQCFVCLIACNF